MFELFLKENVSNQKYLKTTLEFGLSLQRSDWIKWYYSFPPPHKSLSSMRQHQGLRKPSRSSCSASADSSSFIYSPAGAPFAHFLYTSFISEQRNAGWYINTYFYFYCGSFSVSLQWCNEHTAYKQSGWGPQGHHTGYTDCTHYFLLKPSFLIACK